MVPTRWKQIFAGSEAADEPRAEPIASEAPFQVSYAHISERPNWDATGWIEKLAARWLTSHDRIVAEFMLAQNIGEWSKRWRTAALMSAVGILITTLAPLPPWILFLPMVAAGLWGAPLFGGIWPGFNGAATFGGVIPTYANIPHKLWADFARYVQDEHNSYPGLGTVLVAYKTALAAQLGNGPRYGFVLGIEGVVLALVLQPIMITGHFSAGRMTRARPIVTHWHSLALAWHYFCWYRQLRLVLACLPPTRC